MDIGQIILIVLTAGIFINTYIALKTMRQDRIYKNAYENLIAKKNK